KVSAGPHRGSPLNESRGRYNPAMGLFDWLRRSSTRAPAAGDAHAAKVAESTDTSDVENIASPPRVHESLPPPAALDESAPASAASSVKVSSLQSLHEHASSSATPRDAAPSSAALRENAAASATPNAALRAPTAETSSPQMDISIEQLLAADSVASVRPILSRIRDGDSL